MQGFTWPLAITLGQVMNDRWLRTSVSPSEPRDRITIPQGVWKGLTCGVPADSTALHASQRPVAPALAVPLWGQLRETRPQAPHLTRTGRASGWGESTDPPLRAPPRRVRL